MAGPNRIDLEIGGQDRGALDLLNKLQRETQDLRREVERLSGKPIDLESDPAENDLKRLRSELAKLERAFDAAVRGVSFARIQNELERTSQSAKRLAAAEARLAARGKQLIEFSRNLPPTLRQSSQEMDRLEKQTEQAEAAFRRFRATAQTMGRGIGSLVSSVNSLRAGLAAFVAALGVQQILRGARALADYGKAAIETKIQFDKLVPGIRAFAGSTELAEEVIGRLTRTSERLKVPLAGLVDPFTAIVAGGREAGLTIGEINNLFEASLVSARAFGKGADDVKRLLTGIAQVAGKGVASMEEFRQQIGESVPNAIPALAKGLTIAEGRLITTAEAIALVSSGTLDSAKSLRALTIGFEQLNSEAAKGQLDKLSGDLGDLARLSETARVSLADGLEKGLRAVIQGFVEFGEGNAETIKALGELAGATAKPLENLLDIGITLQAIAKESDAGRERVQGFFDGVASGLAALPGLAGFSEEIRNIGRAFTGATAEARAAFQQIEDRARQLVLGTAKSAEDILESFRESFREQAKAAGAADQEIEQSAKDLADAVGKIAEKSQKERDALGKARVKANEGTTEQIQAIEQAASERLIEIEKEAQEQRKKLLQDLVESTKRATDKRVQFEEEAAARAGQAALRIVEEGRVIAAERIAEDEKLASRREEIEAELQEKLIELQEEFVEKLQKPKADRLKLENELLDKVVEAERAAAEKIRDEEARIAKAAEDAAERRRKAEEKVQEARRTSIEQLVELRERLNEVATGTDDEGGSALERTKEDVEELDSALGDLIVTLEQLNAGDLGDPLAGLAESGQDLLGGTAAADFFAGLGQGAEEATESVGDFRGALQDALTAAEGLTGGARDAVLDLIARYADLAESGTATRDDFQSFADELTLIGGQIGSSLDDPVAQVRERIDELRQSQEGAATAAEETARSFEDAGETADVSWNPVTRTLESVEEAAEGAGDAAENLGVRVEKSAEGITVTNEALGETKEAGETAAEGLRAAGEAASEAADSIASAADALEPLQGEIIAEGEPAKIRDLGAAAAEALPQVEPLAAPVQALAGASETLAQTLPLIATQLPAIADATKNLLTTLSGTEIDFDAVAKQIGALAPPLEAISTSLPVIQQAVANLPKPITEVLTAAQPLFERALEVADDDRFGRIGVGLASIAGPLPAIPEPAERFQAVLEKIADRREDITGALKAIAEGLAATSAEEILTGLASLVGSLEDIRELIEGIDSATKSWKETLDQIRDDLPELNKQLSELAQKLDTEVVPAMARAKNEAVEVGKEFEGLRQLTETLKTALEEMGNVGEAALKKITSAAVEAAIALRDVAAAAKEATAAAADVQLPEA